jgi:hypothetical protein
VTSRSSYVVAALDLAREPLGMRAHVGGLEAAPRLFAGHSGFTLFGPIA